ncbi:MAG TPA: hypothetical protein PKJ28_04980 [Bacteroidales bacterium]|nr:hypothetical protein [Bacteroidales bacterium]HPS73500.1 hypothetical protein [Bacteroidales bacterium]
MKNNDDIHSFPGHLPYHSSSLPEVVITVDDPGMDILASPSSINHIRS